MWEATLIDGKTKIQLWKNSDGDFHCHGLTFSGTAGQSHWSPLGESVSAILSVAWNQVSVMSNLKPMDIVVFKDKDGVATHSAVIVQVAFDKNGRLDENSTIVLTKNGNQPLKTMTLREVSGVYSSGTNRTFHTPRYRE
jgi:hypothetical protein